MFIWYDWTHWYITYTLPQENSYCIAVKNLKEVFHEIAHVCVGDQNTPCRMLQKLSKYGKTVSYTDNYTNVNILDIRYYDNNPIIEQEIKKLDLSHFS